jgi:alpha-glucosidase
MSTWTSHARQIAQHEPRLEPWLETVHSDTVPPFLEPELPVEGDCVTIRLRLAAEAPVDRVVVRAIMDGIDHHLEAGREERGRRFVWWRASLELTQPATHYHFLLRTTDGRTVYLNRAGASSVFPVKDFDFTINARYRPPRWVRESVFYQMCPRPSP